MKTPANAPFDPIPDLPLWPGEPPLRRPDDAELREHVRPGSEHCLHLEEVSEPTLSFFPATGKGPHPCVLVCPGGAYEFLAYAHEGIDVAHWLVAGGVSAAVLKYRCPGRRDQALADARRAMRLLRARATEWNLDPARVGICGFSAGANLAIRTCCARDPDYPHADAVDEFSARPDFALPIYPAYVVREGWGTDPDLKIDASAPPTFLAVSQDDPYWESAFAYAFALRAAGVPYEMHVFPDGGHGWGLPPTGRSPDAWPTLAMHWLRTRIAPFAQ